MEELRTADLYTELNLARGVVSSLVSAVKAGDGKIPEGIIAEVEKYYSFANRNNRPHFLDEVSFEVVEFEIAAREMTWVDAVKYSATLPQGWRLPTREELQAYAPQLKKVWRERQPNLEAKNEGFFWSLDAVDYFDEQEFSNNEFKTAWFVNVENGYTSNGNRIDGLYSVVCIRPESEIDELVLCIGCIKTIGMAH
jgi:hypothetical protein